MSKPMIRIHNTETGEIIDREMTDAEFAKFEADNEAVENAKAEELAKRQATIAKLEALGLNEDDLKALGL